MGNTTSTRKRAKVDEQYTRPQGLYPDRDRDVDAKKLRRLILDGKLAPCYPGQEEAHSELEECPICFLHYPSLNNSRCCKKGICTECFLQMKSPIAARPTRCPFCKTPGYAVEHGGPKSAAEKAIEVEEDQRVIEATLRMRQEEQLKSAERAKKREKDLSEGRVPEPPSPTLFPASALGFPAFPPPAPGQPSPSANTPQQSRGQASVTSGQGDLDRSGSGGTRRRSFPSRRVSAIEPDNLWFRAGSAQEASTSNSPRTSAGGQSVEASPSTVDSWANAGVTPGTVGLDVDGGEEGGEGPMNILRAMADTGSDEVAMDLDDVMLNEAIWLSLQEEEERQRRSSGGLASTDHATDAPVDHPRGDAASVQGYQDPHEAAASELARALAASLEQNATWGSASAAGTTPVAGIGLQVGDLPGGLKHESRALVHGSSSARASILASAIASGPDGLGGASAHEDVRRRLENTLDAAAQTGGVNAGKRSDGLTAAADGTSGSGTFRGFELAGGSSLTEDSAQGVGSGGAGHVKGSVAEGLVAEHDERRSSGNAAETSSTGPFGLDTHKALRRPLLQTGTSDVGVVASPNSRANLEAPGGLPLFGRLRADSVYRSAIEGSGSGAATGEGLVSSTIGPVEPLSLARLVARRSPTGPGARSMRNSTEAEREAQPKGVNAAGDGGSKPERVSTSPRPEDHVSDAQHGTSLGLTGAKPETSPPELKDGGEKNHRCRESSRVGIQDSEAATEAGRENGPEERSQTDPGARVVTQAAGNAEARLDSEPASWERFTDGNAFAPSNPFTSMQPFAHERPSCVPEPGLSPRGSDGFTFDTPQLRGVRASSLEPTPSVSLLAGDGDLHPLSKVFPVVGVAGKAGLETGGQKRRARSLSGSNNKVHGEPWTSTMYSPVKYPPPRNSIGPEDLVNAGRIHRRSVSSRDASVPTRSESFKSTGEGKQNSSHAQTAVPQPTASDASFEEQLSAAIALSLAEVEAEEERRKQLEAFEREAYAISVETRTSS